MADPPTDVHNALHSSDRIRSAPGVMSLAMQIEVHPVERGPGRGTNTIGVFQTAGVHFTANQHTRRSTMKSRSKLLLVLTIPALAAIAQTTSKPASPPEPKPTAQSTARAAKPIDGALRDAMIDEMNKCWAALAKQDWATFGGYLADNYMMADPSGLSDKAATMAMVKNGKLGRYALSDWRVARVGEDGVAMTYKADQEWIARDGTAERGNLFCTTTWERQGQKWVIVMYSETPERKPAAPTPQVK